MYISNISDNNASSNYYGICLVSSSNNSLTNNNASGNTRDINLKYSSNNLINNIASNNNCGIGLYYSSSSNNLMNNKYGIYPDRHWSDNNMALWNLP